jgi:hypothetical protein
MGAKDIMLPCVPDFFKFCTILNNYFNRKQVIIVFEKPSRAAHRLSLLKGTFQQDYVNVKETVRWARSETKQCTVAATREKGWVYRTNDSACHAGFN